MNRTIIPLLLITTVGLFAQDYRNNMFGVRHGIHESRVSKRAEVTQVEDRLRPFYHGVASGDPLSDRVIIWTRVTPQDGDTSVTVEWSVATDVSMRSKVRGGTVSTTSARDFTVKIDVDSLRPGTVYYYVFTAYGRSSLIGRTRTLPTQSVDQVRLAVVSCSNYPAGYFNAYARIAERNDLDAVLHLGDYIYEYDADSSSYSGATGIRLGRPHDPDKELVTLTDYRTRYSQYRLDADLRRLHQQHPMIHVWDDHESANDAYTDGAENHQPSTEGDWQVRKAVSKRVCYEWLPTRENAEGTLYRRFTFGSLADLFMLDTRLDGRDIQVQGVGEGASQASKDSLNDPARTMISETQYAWLTNGLTTSTSTWRVIGNQVMFTPVDVTPIDTAYLFNAVGPLFAAFLRPQVPTLQGVFELAFYGDVWSNYPAQRSALTQLLERTPVTNTVIVTGDFHCAFAFDVPGPTKNVAVEFMTPSISASNFDENLGSVAFLQPILPALLGTVDTTLRKLNPHLKWHDITEHGYELVDIRPDRVQCDWFFVDTILARPSAEQWVRGYATPAGTSALTRATAQAPGKSVQDVPTPLDPPSEPVSVEEVPVTAQSTILSYGPNPAHEAFSVTYLVREPSPVRVIVLDMAGNEVLATPVAKEHGLRSVVLDLRSLPSGTYRCVLLVGSERCSAGFIVHR